VENGKALEGWEPLPSDKGSGEGWRPPTLEGVQKELIEIRRRRLLDKCWGDGKHVPSAFGVRSG
jgi:hypothetical protein